MKKMKLRRFVAATVAAITTLSLAACGSGDETGGNAQAKEWVYVPEFLAIEDENVNYYDMKYAGNALYYVSYGWDEETMTSSQSMCKYSLADGSTTQVPVTWTDEKADWSVQNFAVAGDGSFAAVMYVYGTEPNAEGWYDSSEYLCKYDAAGKQIFAIDLTERQEEDPENSYIQSLGVDGQGRIYVAANNLIWLYEADGTYKGSVSVGSAANSWINAMGCGKDGKMYICSYNYEADSRYSLTEIDFDGKKTGASYGNFPDSNNRTLVPGVEGDFLVSDGSAVFEYDLETQSKTEVFNWLDCDINGSCVQGYGVLEDGRIFAIINDWENDDNGVAMLTKTKASEVVQKETVVIASLYSGSDLQSAAVKFNKSNGTYRISIRNYVDYSSNSESAYQDGLTRLLNDITSNNCPDIIDLSGLNLTQLSAKGVFEDLNPYLEKSAVLKADDFLESILKAYTMDGKLVSIPACFEMQTVVGSTEKLGAEMGWTLEELIAFADKYPDAELFDSTTKETMLYYLLMYNENAFVDWATGECKFDTDQFKSLLNFVNRFPDDYNWDADGPSTPTRIQNGEVLLDTAYVYDFESIQIYWEMFGGDITCIGFPSVDGNAGCAMMGSQAYAITSKSANKDGAWAFIENFLSAEDNGRYWFGFPTMKSKLDAMEEEATKIEYVTDENGEPYLDENGEPIVMGGGGGVGYEDGWEYTYTIPSQKEVDIIRSLMDVAVPISYSSESLMEIISEEAAGFFEGQKSVDEVAKIIQSRIKIYVDENR